MKKPQIPRPCSDIEKTVDETVDGSVYDDVLSSLDENLADGMVYQIDSDSDGKKRVFTYLSPAVERLHGLTVDELKRNPALIYGQVIEEDRMRLAVEENRAFGMRKPLDVEVRVRLPSGEMRWRHFKSAPRTLPNGHVIWDGIEMDITDRKLAEEALRRQKVALEKKNIALKEVLAQIETERLETRKRITANIDQAIMPVIKKIWLTASPQVRKYLDMIESELKDVASQFGVRIGSHFDSFSARENEICNMIRNGLSTKEMARMLNVAPRTIDTFRGRIRKKLGIDDKPVNLYDHLQSLAGQKYGTHAGIVRRRRSAVRRKRGLTTKVSD